MTELKAHHVLRIKRRIHDLAATPPCVLICDDQRYPRIDPQAFLEQPRQADTRGSFSFAMSQKMTGGSIVAVFTLA